MTCTAEYFLGVDSPDTLRNLCEEEIDVVDESDAYDKQGYNYKDDGRSLATSFNRGGDVGGIIQFL